MTGEESREPNPVAQIIATRTLQVGGAALLGLAGAHIALGSKRARALALPGGALVSAGLSAYFVATFSAALPLGAPVMTRLPASAGLNAVALTFDDGPHPETTPRLLDLLARYGAKATFFVVGERAARYPDLVRRIRDHGHALGIHGLRHRTMVLQNAREIAQDLTEAKQILDDLSGQNVRLVRPPYGFKTVTLGRVAARLGFALVAWSCDPRDYDEPGAPVLRARLAARLRPGDIVLLHERPGRPAALVAALPGVLADLATRGLVCVPLGADRSL